MAILDHPLAKKAVPLEGDSQPRCESCFAKSICGPGNSFPSCSWCNLQPEFAAGCVICRSNPDLEMHLANVGSFDLTPLRVAQRPAKDWELPRYIPKIVPSAGFPLGVDIPKWTYAMSYHTLTQRKDVICDREWVQDLRKMFPEGSQLILDFFSPDTIVDPIWNMYSQQGIPFWDQKVFENFDAIIAVNNSVYIDDPMMMRHVSLKRTMMSAQEIYDAGHNVIPMMCWGSELELQRQIESIAGQMERVNTVALQLHMISLDRVAALKWNIELIYKHLRHTPWRILINGLTSAWAIRELRRVFSADGGDPNRLVFMNANSWMNTVKLNVANEYKTEYFKRSVERYTRWGNGFDLPKAGEGVEIVMDEELNESYGHPDKK